MKPAIRLQNAKAALSVFIASAILAMADHLRRIAHKGDRCFSNATVPFCNNENALFSLLPDGEFLVERTQTRWLLPVTMAVSPVMASYIRAPSCQTYQFEFRTITDFYDVIEMAMYWQYGGVNHALLAS